MYICSTCSISSPIVNELKVPSSNVAVSQSLSSCICRFAARGPGLRLGGWSSDDDVDWISAIISNTKSRMVVVVILLCRFRRCCCCDIAANEADRRIVFQLDDSLCIIHRLTGHGQTNEGYRSEPW